MIGNSCQIVRTMYRMITLVGIKRTLGIINTTLTEKHKYLINNKKEELIYKQWQIESLQEIRSLLSQPPVTPNDL